MNRPWIAYESPVMVLWDSQALWYPYDYLNGLWTSLWYSKFEHESSSDLLFVTSFEDILSSAKNAVFDEMTKSFFQTLLSYIMILCMVEWRFLIFGWTENNKKTTKRQHTRHSWKLFKLFTETLSTVCVRRLYNNIIL